MFLNTQLPSQSITVTSTQKPYEEIKRLQMKERLDTLYTKFLADPNTHAEDFYELSREFVLRKVRRRHSGTTSAKQDVEDITQVVMADVVRQIDQVRGSSYYAWLHRIVFLQGFESLMKNKAFNAKFIPALTNDPESPEGALRINPRITEQDPTTLGTLKEFAHKRPLRRRRLFPKWIEPQSTDWKIVYYMKGGHGYKEIARLLEMTVPAINSRIGRMRDRAIRENEEYDTAEAVAKAARLARATGSVKAKREATASRIETVTAGLELTDKIFLGGFRDHRSYRDPKIISMRREIIKSSRAL
jgi:DNA-directed RNA polymerase specialized sigma24 family protein